MELVLRVDGREVGREIKLSASLGELLRRVKLRGAKNPQQALAYEVTRELAFQVREGNFLTELALELIDPPKAGVQAPDENDRRDPKWPRDSEVRTIGSDSGEPFQGAEPESRITRSNVG
jgi:hypothetical protein